MISVLLVSRGRPEMFAGAVRALLVNAARPHELDILVRLDEDDPANYLPAIYDASNVAGAAPLRVIRGPRLGYKRLHFYYQELALQASGAWLAPWDDDMVMQTKGWDDIVVGAGGKLVVHVTNSNHVIVPRRLFHLLGHFGKNCHIDSWIGEVSRDANIRRHTGIGVSHCRRHDDATAREREYDSKRYHELADFRKADVRAIEAYLAAHPEEQP